MTNMSDVSEVIEAVDAAEAADTPDLVSRALAISVRPETLVITEVLDKIATDDSGKAITKITPLAFPINDLQLAALREELKGAQFAVDTADGKAAAKKVISKLTAIKSSMEDAYKTWNAPILAMTAHARQQRDHAIETIDAIRAPIKQAVDEQTARETAERTRKAREESDRISAHTAALKVLGDLPGLYVQSPSADIESAIHEISGFDYLSRRDWQEYLPAATDLIRANIDALKIHLANAKAREQLAALQAEQRAADEARAREQAEQDAERERVAALRERIHNIELAPTTVADATSEAISRKLSRLEQTDTTTFDELAAEATAAIENTRNVLQTMLDAALKNEAAARQAADDAAELAELRAEKQRREEAAATARENAEREAREEAERVQREKDEAARIARERAEAVAETLLALLLEARPYVPAGDLAERIDNATSFAQGE